MGEAKRKERGITAAAASYQDELRAALKLWSAGDRRNAARDAALAVTSLNERLGFTAENVPFVALAGALDDLNRGRTAEWLKAAAGGTPIRQEHEKAVRAAAIGTLIAMELQGISRDDAADQVAKVLAEGGLRIRSKPPAGWQIERWWRRRKDPKTGPGPGYEELWSGRQSTGHDSDILLTELRDMAARYCAR